MKLISNILLKCEIENHSRAKIQYANLFLMLYLNLQSLFHCPWAFWAKWVLASLSLGLMIRENSTNLLANQNSYIRFERNINKNNFVGSKILKLELRIVF